MKKTRIHHGLWLTLILALVCAIPSTAAEQEEGIIVKIDTLAIMPFGTSINQFDKSTTIKDMVDCKLFGLCSWEKKDDGSATITRQYQHQLRKTMGYKVIPADQIQDIFEKSPPNPQETLRETAKEFGRQTMASHVLTGTVWRYENRIGSSMAMEQPASVGFTAVLVRTRDGLVVWSKSFEKTQTSLSENLLDAPMFIKKGMHWLSAEELASFGVEETLRTFPVQ